MSLPVRKLFTLTVLSLAIAGCQTHDRMAYQQPLPWKTHPAPPAPPAPTAGLDTLPPEPGSTAEPSTAPNATAPAAPSLPPAGAN